MTDILSMLEKVRPTGNGNYLACCPAHDDRSPSMTVKITDDGRTLMHCFGGCSIDEIVSALGITIDDLFPPRATCAYSERKPFSAHDILTAVSHELAVIGVGAADLMRGKRLSKDDYARMLTAINRVQTARDMACQ